jgi:hypothetical protein
VKRAAAEDPAFLFRYDEVSDVFRKLRHASRKQSPRVSMRLDNSLNCRNVRENGLSRYDHTKMIVYLCRRVNIYSALQIPTRGEERATRALREARAE